VISEECWCEKIHCSWGEMCEIKEVVKHIKERKIDRKKGDRKTGFSVKFQLAFQ
jgi:hypothetical protein